MDLHRIRFSSAFFRFFSIKKNVVFRLYFYMFISAQARLPHIGEKYSGKKKRFVKTKGTALF